MGPKHTIWLSYKTAQKLMRRACPHLLVGLDLTWGLKDMFKKDFETIAFNMYPVYLRLNFGYAF